MNTNIRILILLFIILSSCQKREWNNPYDPECPKEIWTPTNFKAIQEGTTVKLTWSQPVNQISGFNILKGVGGGIATGLPFQSKGINQLIDNSLTGGKVHLYSLTAYAGSNTSNTVTVQITPILIAGITTTEVSAITSNSVSSGGAITTDGGAEITARGVCWSTNQNPTIADSKTNNDTGTGSFTSSITGLTPGATYNIRAYATNSAGTSYGNQVTATTPAILPVITSTTVSVVTFSTASSGGNITYNGGSAVIVRGVCWSTTSSPTIANSKTTDGSGSGSFASSISGLSNNITYYVRAYATNSIGTAYGSEYSVILYMNIPDASITDIDGNVYKTIKIGNQIWMAENLKVTKYSDGTAIPNVTDGTTWASLTSGAYCDFSNSATNGATYGHLYNFYSVVDSRQICPTGWHVPTQSEWTTLINYLEGDEVAGAKLKEVGTAHWVTSAGDNSSGFTGLGGSWRGGDGAFYYYPGQNGCFWTTTLSNNIYDSPWTMFLTTSIDVAFNSDSYHTKKAGNSIRCIKD